MALGIALMAMFALGALSASASAVIPGPGWAAFSSVYPTNLPPGGSGKIQLGIINTGAVRSSGAITVTDTLPSGVTATEAGGMRPTGGNEVLSPEVEEGEFGGARWVCTGNGSGERNIIGASVITCISNPAFLPALPVGAGREVEPVERLGIALAIEENASGIRPSLITVEGGGATTATTVSDPLTISSSQPGFGFAGWDVWLTNADGTPATQAGSHPYEATFALGFNELSDASIAGGEARNLEVDLPPGLFGDPNAVPRCTRAQLDGQQCPAQTQIGVDAAGLSATFGSTEGPGAIERLPVFNMVPPPGVVAEFAFSILGLHAFFDVGVRSGGGYGLVAHVNNLPEVAVNENVLTLWGVPADPSHDFERRAPDCGEEVEGCPSGIIPKPFLTMPTSCVGPQAFTIRGLATWTNPNATAEASVLTHNNSATPVGFTGCEHLSFEPSLSAMPDTSQADTPTGLDVDLRIPQEALTLPGGLVASTLKNPTVTLPEGIVINPGQAAGLVACQAAQANVHGEGPQSCPAASKVGTVKIKTPLLEGALESELEGDVYVLQSNPPNLQLLITASADGIYLKLVGDVHLDEVTGQITTTFKETPELPFTDFKLSFDGGAQAALVTPTSCGSYTTNSRFTPWSTPFGEDVLSSSSFSILSGPGGGACASPPPFTPSMTAGATSDQAGSYTDFSLLLQNGDGQQRVSRFQFKTPRGLSGMLSQVPLCPEPQAAEGSCSAASQIGHAVVASGPGAHPLVVPQPGAPPVPIYLTGPYKGAPFGLSIVTPVIAGPFNLGTVITRAKIEVDPHTAQITITTDPLPQIIAGVPTDLRTIYSVIDRPGFMFNPTNCDQQEFTGTGTSAQGASAPIASRFQLGSCRNLTFKPSFTASTRGNGQPKGKGASLTVKIATKQGPNSNPAAVNEANISKVDVSLPLALPSRLTTLQKACTESQFAANPAGCPVASNVGSAVAHTPVLPVPLEGPAYLVSHGGAAFPDLVIVLQGDGVRVDLIGNTQIKKGITFSKFDTAPDAPISSFELKLPEGPFSVLAANKNLCAPTKTVMVNKRVTRRVHGRLKRVSVKVKKSVPEPLLMPTTITAQNGAVLTQNTKIAVTGCPVTKKKATKAKKQAKKAANTSRAHSKGRR
jgi:hypothetical protein